jgi:hypothetical protein
MKKLTTTIAATLLIIFLMMSCDKDHRDRYTGTWEFVTEKIYFNKSYPYNEIQRETIYYLGKITLGNLEHELIIQFTEYEEVKAPLMPKGVLGYSYSYQTPYMVCHQCTMGSFEGKDKISLSFYIETETMISYHVKGIRKKGGKK